MTEQLRFMLDFNRWKPSFHTLKTLKAVELDFYGKRVYPYPICPITGKYTRAVRRFSESKWRR